MEDVIISILPTMLIAVIGVIYIFVGFELYLNLTNGYEIDFGLPNLDNLSAALIGSLWLPAIVLIVAIGVAFVIIVGGSKIAMFKLGA